MSAPRRPRWLVPLLTAWAVSSLLIGAGPAAALGPHAPAGSTDTAAGGWLADADATLESEGPVHLLGLFSQEDDEEVDDDEEDEGDEESEDEESDDEDDGESAEGEDDEEDRDDEDDGGDEDDEDEEDEERSEEGETGEDGDEESADGGDPDEGNEEDDGAAGFLDGGDDAPGNDDGTGELLSTVLSAVSDGPDEDGPAPPAQVETPASPIATPTSTPTSTTRPSPTPTPTPTTISTTSTTATSSDSSRASPGPSSIDRDSTPTSTATPAPPTSARLRVADVSTNRSVVAEGEPVRITARVVNAGDATGSREVRLRLFGEVVDVRSVTVPGNGARRVSFVREIAAPGTYEATVGDASATITVEAGTRTPGPIVTEPSSQPMPGFTALVAVLAVLAAAALTRRRA